MITGHNIVESGAVATQQSSYFFCFVFCHDDVIIVLLFSGFKMVVSKVNLEDNIANATYDLTESIGKFFVQHACLGLGVSAWEYSHCVDLIVLFPKLDLV